MEPTADKANNNNNSKAEVTSQPRDQSPLSGHQETNTLSDLLNSPDFLAGDPSGFGSACGSPAAPVDLSTLDGIALDFPLNYNGEKSEGLDLFDKKDDKDGKKTVKTESCSRGSSSYNRYYFEGGGKDKRDEAKNRFTTGSCYFSKPPQYHPYYTAASRQNEPYLNQPQNYQTFGPDYNSFHVSSSSTSSCSLPSSSSSSSSSGQPKKVFQSLPFVQETSSRSNSTIPSSSCRFSCAEPKSAIAEKLLQQCLVPVPVPDKESVWFRCKLCQKTEQTAKLLLHASQTHHITDLSNATKQCYSVCDNKREQTNVSGNEAGQYRPHNMNSPPWCEGAFPSDLEDVTISPKNSNQASPFNGNVGVFVDGSGSGGGQSGNQMSTNVEVASSSCSPPSVGDLTSLNPQDHFDPDFDVVDEMKFIDCLIQTMPQSGSGNGSNKEDNVDEDTKNDATDNSADPDDPAGAENRQSSDIYQLQPSTSMLQHYHQNKYDHTTPKFIFHQPTLGPPPPPPPPPPMSHHHLHHHPNVAQLNAAPPPPRPVFESATFNSQPAATAAAAAAAGTTTASNPKKKSPHFRWRRRKRRSKAQYPEMSQYLVPIDEGDEIQHLGRTLECTLCGLRGKRCHLTLHFKAKHSEVIDLNLHRNNGIQTATSATNDFENKSRFVANNSRKPQQQHPPPQPQPRKQEKQSYYHNNSLNELTSTYNSHSSSSMPNPAALNRLLTNDLPKNHVKEGKVDKHRSYIKSLQGAANGLTAAPKPK